MIAKKRSHLVPKLRFPEFRGGPAWFVQKFAELYKFKRTNTLSRDKLNFKAGTIKNIHYGDIHTKFKPLFRAGDESVPYINPDALANRFDDDAFCEEGDIVLADASEDIDDVGKAIEIVSLNGERFVAGTHTILGTRRGDVPIVSFGGHLFQSAAVRAEIRKEAQGTKVYGISTKRISNIPILIPPTEIEQQMIADCLSSLDDLIAAQDRKLEALRRHKQGLMRALFPTPGEVIPQLRFSEFGRKGAWKTEKLGEIITRCKETADPKTYRGALNLIELENIETKSGRILEISEVKKRKSLKIKFQAGDVLFGKLRPYLRKYARPDFSGICTSEIWVLRGNLVSNAFLFYLVQTERFDQFTRISSGSRMPRADWHFLVGVDFEIPHPDVQPQIADCVGSLDDLIAVERRKLAALRRHQQGLMQQLFPSLDEVK